jgi:hypothetical protein
MLYCLFYFHFSDEEYLIIGVTNVNNLLQYRSQRFDHVSSCAQCIGFHGQQQHISSQKTTSHLLISVGVYVITRH